MSLLLNQLAANQRDVWEYKYFVKRCNIYIYIYNNNKKDFYKYFFFKSFYLYKYIILLLLFFYVWLIFFLGEPYSSNFYCSV